MTFKDCLATDINSTFLNGLEFSETHTVNSKEMMAQVDSGELNRRNQMKINVNSGGRSVYQKETLLFVRACDFGGLPKIGATVTLDGGKYIVTAATDELGVYSLSLEAIRA